MKKVTQQICLGLIALIGFAIANAADIGISFMPTQLSMSSCNETSSLTLTNKTSEKQVFQVHSKLWKKSFGKDVYTDTNDLVVTPLTFTMNPGKKQLVRVGFKTCTPKIMKNAYRVFFKQVHAKPLKVKKNVNAGMVDFVLNIGVPVYLGQTPKGKMRK